MSNKLRLLDLFSGIGGFSLGLERSGGFETVAFCEIDPFCRRVLAKHWPEVPQYDDVSTASFEGIGRIDAVSAGFPCQDVSIANQNAAGIAGERSGLFWHVIRTVCVVGRPKLFLENVAELLGRGMGTVLGALASIGYDAQWHCIPASAIGCIQERDRVWIIADPSEERTTRLLTSADISEARQRWAGGATDLQRISSSPFESGDCFPQPLLRRVDDRPSDWVDRVGACGNAVVPQIPEMIGRAIMRSRMQGDAA